MIIRSFSVLALVLSFFSFPSLASAGPHVRVFDGTADNHIHQLAIRMYSAGEETLLASFPIDDLDDFLRPDREYPWQVGIRVSRDDCHDCWIDVLSVDFSLDGSLDPFLVDAPVDDSSGVRPVENLTLNFEEIKARTFPAGGDSTDEIFILNFSSTSHQEPLLPHIVNLDDLGDDDVDLFLVNAPGGDNSVRFGGVLTVAHVPEPSTFALGLLAALCIPFRTREGRNKNA